MTICKLLCAGFALTCIGPVWAQVSEASEPVVVAPTNKTGTDGPSIGPSEGGITSNAPPSNPKAGVAGSQGGAGKGAFAPGTTPSTAISGAPVPNTAVPGTPAVVPGRK